jgi:hypothetical protein
MILNLGVLKFTDAESYRYKVLKQGAFMTDSFKHTGKVDELKINIKEAFDLELWCEEFSLKKEELLEIISKVGPKVYDVRLHLAKRLLINWPVAY